MQIKTTSDKTSSNVTFFPSFVISLIKLECLLILYLLRYHELLTNESSRFQTGSDSVRLAMMKICSSYLGTPLHGYPCLKLGSLRVISNFNYPIKLVILADLVKTIAR